MKNNLWTGILALLVVVLAGGLLYTQMNMSTEKIDDSEWQTVDANNFGGFLKTLEEEDFMYPNDWKMFEIAGGTKVAVYFTDGGDFTGAAGDLQRAYTESEITDYCGFTIFSGDEINTYRIRTENAKKADTDWSTCNDILYNMSAQLKYTIER